MTDLTSILCGLARLSATARAISKGRAGRRAKNIALGRLLGRTECWRGLRG
jgi:hypothetical protein